MAQLIRYILITAGILYLTNGILCEPDTQEDFWVEMYPAMERRNDFFMKSVKSVPRIGRRNDFFGKKLMKNVPRVGRSNEEDLEGNPTVSPVKRSITSVDKDGSIVWPWYRDQEFIPRVVRSDVPNQ